MKLGLKGYISRGFTGHIRDEVEAAAGLELFRATSPQLIERVTAHESKTSGGGNPVPNWNSLKALRQDGKVIRGAVFYHSDLKDRLAPVEVTLPADFLKAASTTPELEQPSA